MRFATISATFLGLCASVVLANDSLEQRDPEVVSYDLPLHPCDFSVIMTRNKKCGGKKKRDLTKRAKEIWMNTADVDSTEVAVEGTNGCSGVFVWTDTQVFGLHTPQDDFTADVQKLKTKIGTAKIPKITHVTISAPDAGDSNTLKGKLGWTNKTPAVQNYPYDENNGRNMFTLSAKFANKGQVNIKNEPLSKSVSPDYDSTSSEGSKKGKRAVRVEDDE